MNVAAIAHRRLVNQQIARQRFGEPGEVVQWLGAVQAQDYLGALWALGLRTPGATEAAVEAAVAAKTVVRTWPMRGTIHFVAPADARWMLELMTPRVVQNTQGRLRQLGLDAQTIAASGELLARALAGGKQLTRDELRAVLEAAGIAAQRERGMHILGQLAQAGLICFGARNGKQPTFTLLDEWAPGAKSLPRDEALATLALRYFSGHGPATIQDFIWWSGLTTADAKAGLAAAAPQLRRELIEGREYYAAPDAPGAEDLPPAFLLPPFDEFLIGYRDRGASLDPAFAGRVVPGGNGIFNPIVVTGGRVTGTWRRALKKASVTLSFSPFGEWSAAEREAIAAAAEGYARFHGKAPLIEW